LQALLQAIADFTGSTVPAAPIASEVRAELERILQLPALEREYAADPAGPISDVAWGGMLSWACVHALGKLDTPTDYAEQSRTWIDEWRLGQIITDVLYALGADEPRAWQTLQLVKQMTSYQEWFRAPELRQPARLVEALLADSDVQQLLRINRYQGVLWFDKGAFDTLLTQLLRVALVSLHDGTAAAGDPSIAECAALIAQVQAAAENAGYQVDKLRTLGQG
ncbi:hypothetical protein SE17_31545, partial [Kouleothrix aurantiaca]